MPKLIFPPEWKHRTDLYGKTVVIIGAGAAKPAKPPPPAEPPAKPPEPPKAA
jgi:hypothetical protein